jgi:GNAT superfamily N-acetyltransferase
MSADLTISVATPDDVAEIIDLYDHLTPGEARCSEPDGRAILDRLSLFPGSAVLLGRSDGVLVGSCTLVIIPNLSRGGRPYALIENVVTHGDHRQKGIGTALLAEAKSRAFAAGCYKVMLMTGSTRPSTLRFYEKAGFEQSKTGFQVRAP